MPIPVGRRNVCGSGESQPCRVRFNANHSIRSGEKNGEPSHCAAPEFDLPNLLLYMFSPTSVTHNYFGYTDRARRPKETCWPIAPTADGPPTKAHLKLMTESMRME